jgi:hypothetical protein
MARRARPRFRGPAADSELGEAFLDALPIVAAVGFAADVSQCVQLCGVTFRAGDRGATNDMLVQSLRLQCGAREARAAGREGFEHAGDVNVNGWTTSGTTQLIPLCNPRRPAARAAAHPARRRAGPCRHPRAPYSPGLRMHASRAMTSL